MQTLLAAFSECVCVCLSSQALVDNVTFIGRLKYVAGVH